MTWQIPAKTFLLGEYAAIAEESAIVLSTSPYFELSFSNEKQNEKQSAIHPQSPAGLWWQKQGLISHHMIWKDPYLEIGGLGASSAQFLASYLASNHLHNRPSSLKEMLEGYYQVAWSGSGLRPSGYDVIAQSQQGCVFINKKKRQLQAYHWPFQDLSFLLIHTGVKLATHHHLQNTALPSEINRLSTLADRARVAFDESNSMELIYTINQYHNELSQLNLVASHSMNFINELKTNPEILAIKGCGALGSDILLIITSRSKKSCVTESLGSQKWTVLACEDDLTTINTPPLLAPEL